MADKRDTSIMKSVIRSTGAKSYSLIPVNEAYDEAKARTKPRRKKSTPQSPKCTPLSGNFSLSVNIAVLERDDECFARCSKVSFHLTWSS